MSLLRGLLLNVVVISCLHTRGVDARLRILDLQRSINITGAANTTAEGKGPMNIFVYQYGKVASTSLTTGLQNAGYGPFKHYAASWEKHLPRSYQPVTKTHSRAIAQDYLRKRSRGQSCLIVTASRLPFPHVISGSFQGLKNSFTRMTDKQVIQRFHEQYVPHRQEKTAPFFADFNEDVGVDLFSQDAKVARKGYGYWPDSRSGCAVLLLRFEDIANWDEPLRKYVPGWFSLPHTNSGAKKFSNQELRYNRLVSQFTFTEQEVKGFMAYDTWHFYSQAEKNAVLAEYAGSHHSVGFVDFSEGRRGTFELAVVATNATEGAASTNATRKLLLMVGNLDFDQEDEDDS